MLFAWRTNSAVLRAQEESLASDLATDRFVGAFEEAFSDSWELSDALLEGILTNQGIPPPQAEHIMNSFRDTRPLSLCPAATAKQRASFAASALGAREPERVVMGDRPGEGVGYRLPVEGTLRRLLANPHVLRAVANPPPPSAVLDDEAAGSNSRANELSRLYPDALRLRLYYDDLELCEVKSSYSRKVGAFYLTLLNLPRQHRSTLESIEVVAVAREEDIAAYGLSNLLGDLIHHLRKLQRGWRCQLAPGVEWTFHGFLANTLGDNLGQQYMGAWKEGSAAFLCCRHCLLNQKDIQLIVTFALSPPLLVWLALLMGSTGKRKKRERERERKCCASCPLGDTFPLLSSNAPPFPFQFFEVEGRQRNWTNYCEHLAWLQEPNLSIQERGRRSKETGINSGTILCEVPFFDPTRMMDQDVFHDLLEGFVGHHLRLFLHHLVITTKQVDLETLNGRIGLPPLSSPFFF
jgi:hypothetical protein